MISFIQYIFNYMGEWVGWMIFVGRMHLMQYNLFRFLEYSQLQGMMTSYSYETELATLQEVIQQKVATMFSDPSNIVKRTLMEKTVTKLCVFFGKQKGNSSGICILLSLIFCRISYFLIIYCEAIYMQSSFKTR